MFLLDVLTGTLEPVRGLTGLTTLNVGTNALNGMCALALQPLVLGA
jgi:hypothetical protein